MGLHERESMTRPLVLVHGLWDTPRLFCRLIQAIDRPQRPLMAPHLPHGLGAVSYTHLTLPTKVSV